MPPRGGTHGVEHSLSLSLLGPAGPEHRMQARQESIMVILITSIYCAPTQMATGQLSKPFVIITSIL